MSEDTEAEEVSQEEAEIAGRSMCLKKKKIQDTVEEEVMDSEPAVEVSQEEVEEFPNSEEVSEEENLSS